jgi:drug/metabolite transporter (DMT)-like permease
MGTTQVASVMAFYQNVIFLVGSTIAAALLGLLDLRSVTHPSLLFLVRSWTTPSVVDGLLIATCGVVAAIGTLLLTNAYRIAKTSVVTPFEYTGILWAPLWGFLFFAETPKFTTFIGAAIIAIAGIIAMRVAKH